MPPSPGGPGRVESREIAATRHVQAAGANSVHADSATGCPRRHSPTMMEEEATVVPFPQEDDRQIVAFGGGGFSMEAGTPLLDEYVMALARARRERPRVCFLPTASGDADHYIVRFYRAFPG